MIEFFEFAFVSSVLSDKLILIENITYLYVLDVLLNIWIAVGKCIQIYWKG